MHTTTIETPRLVLAPFEEDFLTPRYVAWLNSPQTVRFSEQRHTRHTQESCQAYLESFAGTPHFFWAICLRGEAQGHIGNMTACIHTANASAELGILLGEESCRGLGLGLEALLGVSDHLFRVTGVRKVVAGTMETNATMCGLARKAGMIEDGRRTRHFLWENQEVDAVYFALYRESWFARFPQPPFSTETRPDQNDSLASSPAAGYLGEGT